MTAALATRRFAAAAACVGVAALVIRLLYLVELSDTPFFSVPVGDGWQYDQWAQRIASGEWLGSESFYQSPLYPYFLGVLFSIFGHSLTAVRVVQAVLGAVACALIAVAGRTFFDARAGLAAGGMLAIYPFAIFSDGLIQKSSLDAFLVCALLALLGAFLQSSSRSWALALAGIALGLLTLNRETTRLLYPVIACWLLWPPLDRAAWRARLTRAALFTAAVALVVMPVGIRNYVVSGEFLLSTWQLGPNFYIGNNPAARGYYEPLVPGGGSAEREREDATRLAEEAAGRRLTGAEISRYWLDRSFAYIHREPLKALKQFGVKTVLAFNAREISDSESPEAYAEFSSVLRALGWFSFAVVMAFSAAGMWLTRDRWRTLWLLYATFAALLVPLIVFYVFARYRYPIVPVAMLFAGAAVAQLPDLRRRAARSWSPALLAAAAVALFCSVPAAADLADTTFYNVGVALLKSGRQTEGVRLLEKAVERAPDDAAAHFELGGALSALGEKTRAIDAFEAAVRLRPDHWESRLALGLARRDLGSIDHAAANFAEAVRLNPESAAARRNLGMALFELGEDDRAMSELREAVRLRPDDFAVHYAIAQLHARAGRGRETLQALETALAAAKKSGTADDVARIEEAVRLTKAQIR